MATVIRRSAATSDTHRSVHILVNEGADPASASAVQVADAYALAAANAKLLNSNIGAEQQAVASSPAMQALIKSGRVKPGSVFGASGGMITEHIIGYGQKTGTQYHIGEAGPEALIPLNGGGPSGSLPPLPVGGGGGGGGGVTVHVSFPNSLTFLNNAGQIDELARAIEARLVTVRLPHRGVRMSPH